VTELFAGSRRERGGWIEVIVGCMFSGKTEELIKRVRRAHIAKLRSQTFKPTVDTRYSSTDVASHDENKLAAFPVTKADELLSLVHESTIVVAIDEGQFFGNELVEVVDHLASTGRRVIVSGLDTDWRGRPFGPMPQLMAVAEVVLKQHAVCRVCGEPATRTQRLIAAEDDILVGSSEAYEARCRRHFDPRGANRPLTETVHDLSSGL
jgi:thymidine kinase